jgi:hypothetical protein
MIHPKPLSRETWRGASAVILWSNGLEKSASDNISADYNLLPAIDRRRALAPDMAARPRQVTSVARGHRQRTM